jgi:hypothetical protein
LGVPQHFHFLLQLGVLHLGLFAEIRFLEKKIIIVSI